MPPLLYNQFQQFVKIMNHHDFKKDHEINIDRCKFLPPVLALPLLYTSKNYNKPIKKHYKREINEYINKIQGKSVHSDTTFPFKAIQQEEDNSMDLTQSFINIMGINKENDNAFKFIFAELLTNVYDHSKFNEGYILAQAYPKLNQADFCFMDDGLGIPGTYEKSGYSFKNDSYNILEAINGHSTKYKYDDKYSRGTGLNNTISVLTDAGGSIIIVSGKGIVFISKNRTFLKEVPNTYINGTLICIRLNLNNKMDVMSNLKKVNYTPKDDNMKTKEIFLEEQINQDLGSRNKMEELFNMLNKSNAEKIIMNFEKIEFMGRSVAQEYLNQKEKASFEIVECNMPEDIKEFLNAIIEINKKK